MELADPAVAHGAAINADEEIGDLIADAMERVGKEGVIAVQDGKNLENALDVVEGMKFDRGFTINHSFISSSANDEHSPLLREVGTSPSCSPFIHLPPFATPAVQSSAQFP